jgi:bifunctional enzyme CysN/CysC
MTVAFAPAHDHSPAIGVGDQSMLRFFTCGSVDDGKSTLIGRLLYDSKSVFEDQLGVLDKDSKKFGTQGDNLDFALLVDGLSAEREQGITIDVAYRYFSTPRRSFIVADTPGHEQYTRNMATGASTADLAIILIDARKGILPQTRRHSFIVSMLRVRRVVLAINKMDLVAYDEAVFRRIVDEYGRASARLGFASIECIPISARDGDNVTASSRNMPWYRGPALLDYLEAVDVSVSTPANSPFRMPVQWVNRPDLDFRGFAGTIASGAIAQGDEIVAQPSGRRSRVARIVTFDGDLPIAEAEQAVTLTLTDEVDVSRGDVLVATGDRIAARRQANANLIWMVEEPLRPGRDYVIKLATATANASVSRLHHAVDIHTFEPKQADLLRMNDIGLVTLSFDKPLVSTDYAESRDLGGFILIDRLTNMTAAIGLIDSSADIHAAERKVADDTSLSHRVTRLRTAVRRRIGEPKSVRRRNVMRSASWRLVAALAIFGLVLALSGNFAAALIVATFDLAARPLARRWHEAAWRRPDDDPENLDSGAGI